MAQVVEAKGLREIGLFENTLEVNYNRAWLKGRPDGSRKNQSLSCQCEPAKSLSWSWRTR
jgi:hypothetical protein